MTSEVMDVCCVATPDGQAFWCEASRLNLQTCWDNWKRNLSEEQRALYEKHGICGGVTKLRMLRSDFQRIPATNGSAAFFGGGGGSRG